MSATGSSASVAVIGAGYVGLPTAALLARLGHTVICAEREPGRLDLLLAGRSPIMEAGLEELLAEGGAAGRLRFVRSAAEAVRGAAFVFLCVDTPQADDGSADLSAVEAAAAEIAPNLEPGVVVVNKSTVPVGTATLVKRVTGATVVSNPEFLREGSAVRDSLRPDRIVVGSSDRLAARRVGELFAGTGAPLIVTDTVTAETIKYASNAFLATKLSFVNALSGLCESLGADVRDVVLGMGYDRRIGFDFVRPGPGWGGSCLPKDTAALVHIAGAAGYEFSLLHAAIAANREAQDRVVGKVAQAAGGSLAGATVAVWGLTFKAGTDDRRSSPAVAVAQRLVAAGSEVRAFDPTVDPSPASAPADLAGLTVCSSAYEACRDASVVVVLTEWEEFRILDLEKVAGVMRQTAMVDARNLFDPRAVRRAGFDYTGVGRP